MRNHKEILDTYADEKTTKTLGETVKQEIDTLDDNELKSLIVQSLENMTEASEKLAANPKYQDLKTRLEDVTAGKKEVDKFQGAKIKYARKRLREIGKLVPTVKQELELSLGRAKAALDQHLFKLQQAKDYVPPCPLCNKPLAKIDHGGGRVEAACLRCDAEPAV